MDSKEIKNRLEIIKLAATIGDSDTIVLQTSHLKSLENKKIDEIILLLNSKNYRQAIYLIKSFFDDNDILDNDIIDIDNDGTEKVLGVEDMLRMSPLAKETIKEYKSSAYTQDDLEAFAKNIEVPIADEYEKADKNKKSYEEKFIEVQEKQPEDAKPIELKEIKTEGESNEFDNAIESANQDTPLDEISAEVLNGKEKAKRTNVFSKYKTLRSKFAKKEKPHESKKSDNSDLKADTEKVENSTPELKVNDNIQEKVNYNITEDSDKKSEQSKIKKESFDDIYPPIPHIEQKFRQAFVLYPPSKESEVWIEEVIKFLKHVSSNSYTDNDVKSFLDEYKFYLDKGDIARAAQVLLLAAATDSKYAKFILARELFNGRVLKRDLKKSYTAMKNLASKHYPDAFCDLAQFYEYGIGVPKDKKTALKLYEKAFELGVNRATKHINRIKESGGFLSSFFK